jgi:CTP-dependent riboflavin kinase
MKKINDIEIFGRIISGRGQAQRVVEQHYTDIIKVTKKCLFPGSLNVFLTYPVLLDTSHAQRFDNNRYIWLARIEGLDAPIYVYRWRGCPLHIVELFSTVKLRDVLGIIDFSEINISISTSMLGEIKPINYAVWYMLWRFREPYYYSCETYKKFIYFLRIRFLASQ